LTLRVRRAQHRDARNECCAAHERRSTHEDLNSATSNDRVYARRSAAVTLTVRAFEE
jgi:hypothetical protein